MVTRLAVCNAIIMIADSFPRVIPDGSDAHLNGLGEINDRRSGCGRTVHTYAYARTYASR